MIKRTLYFSNPTMLRMKDKQLKAEITNENGETEIKTAAIEDLGVVVIDHPQITITSGLIQELQENNVALITCDKKRLPQSLLLPIEGNKTQRERYQAQIEATEPLKKQLWQQTITYKIRNQAAVLNSFQLRSDYLVPLHKNVKSGDSDNCEATAAAYYWRTLLGHINGFRREKEGPPPNNYLNYGYAILRGAVARSIVIAGLLPTLGIHHRNRYNAYCLADDLMEPYRPYVDEIVYKMVNEMGLAEDLGKEHKKVLMGIPYIDVKIDGETSPLMIATQKTATSLVKCYMGEQRKLIYTEI
jgi:CRISPR-associated protein Cas1